MEIYLLFWAMSGLIGIMFFHASDKFAKKQQGAGAYNKWIGWLLLMLAIVMGPLTCVDYIVGRSKGGI